MRTVERWIVLYSRAVVMVTSVVVRWDSYYGRVKGTVGERAVVTVDPISKRATRLQAYLPHAHLLKTSWWDPPVVGEGISMCRQRLLSFRAQTNFQRWGDVQDFLGMQVPLGLVLIITNIHRCLSPEVAGAGRCNNSAVRRNFMFPAVGFVVYRLP